jgi:predicted nucleic acid-binding Zn ribbon protein
MQVGSRDGLDGCGMNANALLAKVTTRRAKTRMLWYLVGFVVWIWLQACESTS